MNDDLVHAIGDKYLVEFAYKAGGTRIVERHDYGTRCDVECLFGFQVSGDSKVAYRMDGKSSTSIRSATYASWTVGPLVRRPIARRIIEREICSSPV